MRFYEIFTENVFLAFSIVFLEKKKEMWTSKSQCPFEKIPCFQFSLKINYASIKKDINKLYSKIASSWYKNCKK